jgi:hypothetical protein
MMISIDNSTTGQVTIGSSSSIDFAFWILMEDGLHAPYFDKHTGGNQILQHYGMTAQSWNTWLKLILIKNDNRLSWRVPNIQTATEENVQSFQQVLEMTTQQHNTVCDEEWHDSQYQFYSQLLTEQEQGYQEAIADYQGIDLNFSKENKPPQLWQDSSTLSEILMKKWNDYQIVKYSNQAISDFFNKPNFSRVQSNPTTHKYREIYLVDYPYEVEVFIPPIFAIVTLPNRPVDEAQLESRIFHIIQVSEQE